MDIRQWCHSHWLQLLPYSLLDTKDRYISSICDKYFSRGLPIPPAAATLFEEMWFTEITGSDDGKAETVDATDNRCPEIDALLRYYAAYSGNFLQTFKDNIQGADKSLARSDWKSNWKVAIFRPTPRSLLPRRSGWTDNITNVFFFEWLAKVRVWSM